MTAPSSTPERINSVQFLERQIDVTGAAGLGEPVHVRATIALPAVADLPDRPIVCFAQPGAGYSRRYFTLDLPSFEPGGQAAWHASRGWIFVAIDPLGVGDSSLPDWTKLMFPPVCAASHAAVEEILQALRDGAVADQFPAIRDPVVLGIGQSMGGGLTVVQQARHRSYDGIGVLGFSAVHTFSMGAPGLRPAAIPALARDTVITGEDLLALEVRHAAAVNRELLELQAQQAQYPGSGVTPPGWLYHFDDVPRNVVELDLGGSGELPPWRSATMPGLVHWVTAHGAIAPEAGSIVAPVLAAFGERDSLKDPRLEPKAYCHAPDFSLFICPRMGHMHNFAGTREVFWSRIHHWGLHVAELKARLPDNWPARLFSDSY